MGRLFQRGVPKGAALMYDNYELHFCLKVIPPSDENAGKYVDNKINAIDMNAENKAEKIADARGAYERLTEEQKKTVKELSKLESYENQLKDEEKVSLVNDLIDKLPDSGKLALKDGDSVKAARDAYDKLTENQKKLVSSDSVKKLEDAEAAYAKLVRENGPKTGDSASIAIYAYYARCSRCNRNGCL